MNLKLLNAAIGGLVVLLLGLPAHALVIGPADADWTSDINSNFNGAQVATVVGTSTTLTLMYKADVGSTSSPATTESGVLASSYETTFLNSALDPMDALIRYVSGAAISCGECYLVVKDGNQSPAQYFFSLAGWNGTESLDLRGFWPQRGAISNVAIWGAGATSVPEPGSLALLGAGLLALGLVRRRKIA